MAVDVLSEIRIERPRAVVAGFAVQPDNATAWYRNIRAVNWVTPPPLAVGSEVAFMARFLGRTLRYTYEVVSWEPGERFVMRTSDGPFPMETTYAWYDVSTSATLMQLRNRGEPHGFGRIAAPTLVAAMRRANNNDLVSLKAILENTE